MEGTKEQVQADKSELFNTLQAKLPTRSVSAWNQYYYN